MPVDKFSRNHFLHFLLFFYGLVFLVTGIAPRDRAIWALENILVVILVGILITTYRRFAFSNASYYLIGLFLTFHAIGAHTGYAHSPVGEWMRDRFFLSRNPYDRVAHFAFGLFLTYPIKEFLKRRVRVFRWEAWTMSLLLILGASSIFEVVEAVIAESVSPGAGPDWLGGQGDEWDAQMDMFMALAGAVIAVILTQIIKYFPQKPRLRRP